MIQLTEAASALARSALLVTVLIGGECVILRLTECWKNHDIYNSCDATIEDFVISGEGRTGYFVCRTLPRIENAVPQVGCGAVDLATGKPGRARSSARDWNTSRTPRFLRRIGGPPVVHTGAGAGVAADHPWNLCLDFNLLRMPGRNMVLRFGNRISAWREDTCELLWDVKPEGSRVISADGSDETIYCGLSSGKIIAIRADDGQTEAVCQSFSHSVLQLDMSPCGTYLAVLLQDARVLVIRCDDGTPLWTTRTRSLIFCPGFSHDGSQLLITDPASRSTLIVVDSQTGHHQFRLGEHPGVTHVVWDPRQATLYSWGMDGCIRAWSLTRPGQPQWEFRSRPTELLI